ncbi:MAG: galactose-1-phosphate uridylyltransferase [Pseudomonadota bacterium]
MASDAPINETLDCPFANASVYRRHILRADGRDVWIYGYSPNTETVVDQPAERLPQGGELRWHPLRQEWNIYAAHRQERTFKPSAADNPLAPTRPGSAVTEIPIADFELAVFDNRFTSLHPDAAVLSHIDGARLAPAVGQCEVIVYGTEPQGNLHSMGQQRRELLLAAWADRIDALHGLNCDYVLPFENRGDAVGVTLPHPHGQIYGFGDIPPAQRAALQAFESGFSLEREIAALDPRFIVNDLESAIAWCPPYARFPYEVWIAPRSRRAGLATLDPQEASDFAVLLGDVTQRYDAFFGQPTPYMMAIHAAPRALAGNWHLTAQFYPILRAPGRLKYLASVEQHTGVFTVDVMPERAAQVLRELNNE